VVKRGELEMRIEKTTGIKRNYTDGFGNFIRQLIIGRNVILKPKSFKLIAIMPADKSV
jgi:hypothetical protein